MNATTQMEKPRSSPANTPTVTTPDPLHLHDDPFFRAKTLKFILNFLRREKGRIEDCDFFNFIAEVLGPRQAIKLARVSRDPQYLNDLTRRQLAAGREVSPLNLLMERWNEPRTHRPFAKALLAALEKKLAQAEKHATAATARSVLYQRFQDMIRLFSLNECEADLLLLAYVRHAGIWCWTDLGRRRGSGGRFDRVQLMCQALGVPLSVGAKYLWKSARLRTLSCLDDTLDFNSELEPFLLGFADEPLASNYFSRCTEPTLPWTMHGRLAEEHGTFIKRLVNLRDRDRSLNILLYGPPGTGKTSFAASLAIELDLDLYRIRVPEEREDGDAASRLAAVQICDSQINRQGSMILIDEADDLLVRDSAAFIHALLGPKTMAGKETGALNTLLDIVKTPCIWITNAGPDAIAESSRRRFDYSIRFDALTRQQRRQVWINAIERYGLQNRIAESLIDEFAERFPVSAGGIDLALRHFARLCDVSSPQNAHQRDAEMEISATGATVALVRIVLQQAKPPDDAEPAADAPPPHTAPPTAEARQVLEKLLAPHCELLQISTETRRSPAGASYALDGLNVTGRIPPSQVLEAIRRFRRLAATGSAPPAGAAPCLTVLLSGPPGTGKTEFVKFIGRELDCPVRTCMAGDFLDRYVGGTEQKIRRAFAAAAADRAILFIDEADGMFRTRALADRGWEVTQVNELLHAMENFTGVLVCATNSVEILDPATIRRFTFKLEFEYLDVAGKQVFYEKMFAQICKQPLDEAGRRRLAAIADLAPGDFHTVQQAMYYVGGSGGGNATHDDMLAALEQEVRAKRQGRGGNFGFGRG